MSDQEIAVQATQVAQVPQTMRSVQEVVDQMAALEDLMRKCLKKGDLTKGNEGDYYTLPGGKKPCLSKAGAQKVAMMFRLSASYEIEDLSTATESRYRVRCQLARPDGTFMGEAWGESSSAESKAHWRKALDDEEYEDANVDEKRTVKRKTFKGEVYEVKQIMVNRADSTVRGLPVAQKRAYVQAVLAASGASCLFTSDLESVPKYDNGKPEHEPIRRSQPKPPEGVDVPPQKPDIGNGTGESREAIKETFRKDFVGTVQDIVERKGVKNDKPWICWFVSIDGQEYVIFSESIAALAQKGVTIRFTWKPGTKPNTRQIVTAEPVTTEPPPECEEGPPE